MTSHVEGTAIMTEEQTKKDLRIVDREGRIVSQGALNALLAELDKTNAYRNALTVIGCRGIPPNRKRCDCIVHLALRGQAVTNCTWDLKGDWVETTCGHSWLPSDEWNGEDHEMKFCAYCGRSLAVSDALRDLNKESSV